MFKYRTLFAILGSFGMAIIYGFKVNLSVAIVAMVNQSTIIESDEYVYGPNNMLINDTGTTNILLCKNMDVDEPQNTTQVYF